MGGSGAEIMSAKADIFEILESPGDNKLPFLRLYCYVPLKAYYLFVDSRVIGLESKLVEMKSLCPPRRASIASSISLTKRTNKTTVLPMS